jgi:hypothetical protein
MESDADKALEKMMFIYLHQIKIASLTMSLRLSEAASTRTRQRDRNDKLKELPSTYAQFIKDAEPCKRGIQAVMDAGSINEEDAKNPLCVSARPSLPQ